MSLTAAQSHRLLQQWMDKQRKQAGAGAGQAAAWDRKQLQAMLKELEAGPTAKRAVASSPRDVVSGLLARGSGAEQAAHSKAAAFGKGERDARNSRERVAKQHATAAKRVALTVPAANPSAARPHTAAPQGIAAIPFFQTRKSRPRSTSASRCRSCSRSPDHGAVAPHSPPAVTHPPVSSQSIHPHEFLVGIGDCRPEGAAGIGHQHRETNPSLSPPRVQLDQQAAYQRQQKQARRLQMSKQAQEAAWLDPAMSHVSAATLHHMHDPAKQTKQPKKKRSSKGIQAVAATATSAEAQAEDECDQLPSLDGAVDVSRLPAAGLPTAVSSAREGALKFIASPSSRAAAASPARVASNYPATSSAAYGAGVVSPRRAAAGGFVPQPHVPQKSQHNASSINVFAHDDNGQGALAEEKGRATNSYRELQERIKHNQYKPAAGAGPRPTVSMAPAAGIRSAVEPPFKGPAQSVSQAPARPATAPVYPAQAAWEEERVALLKELTAAQLRENASMAELNARKTRPEGAVAWWPQDDAHEDEDAEGAMTERMRAQREQINNMRAAADLAKAKQDKIERDQAAKENAARAASPPRASARFRRGASVGPVIKSPPFAHVGPAEARAYSATIRAAGSSPPHSHGGAHEQHRYNLHHRRDSEVSEGEYSFKNVDGELADQLRESLRQDVAREAADEDAAYNARSQRRAAAMAGAGLDDEFKQFDDEDRADAAAAASQSRQGEPSMRVGGDVSVRPSAQGGQAFFIPAGPASARQAPPFRRGEVSQSFQAAPSAAAGFGPSVDAAAHDLAESLRQRAAADQLKHIIAQHESEQAEQRKQAAGLAQKSAEAHAWINRFEMEAGMEPSLPSQPPPTSASFRASVAPLPPAPVAQAPTMHSSMSASRGPGYSQSADTSIESVMHLAHNPIIQAFKRDPSTVRMPPATVAAVAVAAAAAVEATVGPNSPLRNSRNPRSARSSPARGGVADVARQFSPARSVGASSSSVAYRPLSPPARVSDLSDVSSNVSQLSSAPAVPMTAAALASQQKLDWYSAELARLQERQAERERQQQAQLPAPVAAAAAVPFAAAAPMSHYSGGSSVPAMNAAAAEAALAASAAFGDASSSARASAEARARERARLESEYVEALRTQREQAERKMEDLTRKALQSSQSRGFTSPSRSTSAIPPVVAAFVPPMGSTGAGIGAGAGTPASFVVSVRLASSFAPPAAATAPGAHFSTAAPAPSHSLNASYLSQISSMGASSSSMRSSFGPGAPPRAHSTHQQPAVDLDTPSELSSASDEEDEQLRRATNASRGIPARGVGAGSTLHARGVYSGPSVESGESSDDDDAGASVAVATAAAAAHLDDTLDSITGGDDVNGSLDSVGTDEDAELDEESESYFASHVKRTYEVTVTIDEAKRN